MGGNPFLDQCTIIKKGQVSWIESGLSANSWQLVAELHVSADHICGAANAVTVAGSPQPVSHRPNGSSHIVVMRANVLSSNIRAEDLIAVLLAIENQTRLTRLQLATKTLRSEKYSKLEWHVESRQPSATVERNSRQNVNTIAAFANYVEELVETDLAAVILLPRTARHEAAIVNGEYQRIEELLIPCIERHVDKDPLRLHMIVQLARRYFLAAEVVFFELVFAVPRLVEG